MDIASIKKSVKKTKKLLCIDTGCGSFSVSSEIIASMTQHFPAREEIHMQKVGLPDVPEPTSYALTKDFYPNADSVVKNVCSMFGLPDFEGALLRKQDHHDVPGNWFQGPF